MSDIVTHEFLQALLSPDRDQREQAAWYWQSLPVEQRTQELLLALPHHGSGHLQQLVAVLLRRDILLLIKEDILDRLLNELLSFFCSAPSAAIGDCLTEIVFVLNEINEPSSIQAMQTILNASSHAVVSVESMAGARFSADYRLSRFSKQTRRHSDIPWR